MTFELNEILIAVGFIQSILLMVALGKKRLINRSANRVLLLFLGFASAMLLGRLFFIKYMTPELIPISLYLDGIIFLFGPLLLTYFKKLLFESTYRPGWYHFLPYLMHIGLAIDLHVFWGQFLLQPLFKGNFRIMFIVIEAAGVLSGIFYSFWTAVVMFDYKQKAQVQFSFKQEVMRYLQAYVSVIVLCQILWLFAFVNVSILQNTSSVLNYDTVWLGMSVFTIFISYSILSYPEIFQSTQIGSTTKETKSNEASPRLSNQKVRTISNEVEKLAVSEETFLNPSLTLGELAEKLGVSNNDLSWWLNNVMNMSFYDFVNQHRISEFVKKLEGGEHEKKSLLGLAYDVGFNSKATFYNSFRKVHDSTPSRYVKENYALEPIN